MQNAHKKLHGSFELTLRLAISTCFYDATNPGNSDLCPSAIEVEITKLNRIS